MATNIRPFWANKPTEQKSKPRTKKLFISTRKPDRKKETSLEFREIIGIRGAYRKILRLSLIHI